MGAEPIPFPTPKCEPCEHGMSEKVAECPVCNILQDNIKKLEHAVSESVEQDKHFVKSSTFTKSVIAMIASLLVVFGSVFGMQLSLNRDQGSLVADVAVIKDRQNEAKTDKTIIMDLIAKVAVIDSTQKGVMKSIDLYGHHARNGTVTRQENGK